MTRATSPYHRRGVRLAAPIVVSLSLGACSSTPVQDFTLSGPDFRPQNGQSALSAPRRYIDLVSVSVPEALMRPQWVTRGADGASVRILPHHRWASAFDKEWRDALSEQLAAQLSAVDVHGAVAPAGAVVWRLTMTVSRFDVTLDRDVTAAVNWSLHQRDVKTSSTCIWRGTVPVGTGAPAAALGAQAVVRAVGTAVSQQLLSLEQGQTPVCAP